MDILEAIRDEINNSDSFQFVPAIGPSEDVELEPNGTSKNSYFNLWELEYDKSNIPTLKLKQESNLVAVLLLDKTGNWKGRARGSNGFIMLRPPAGSMPRWKLFSEPNIYYRAITASTKIEGELKNFKYREALPPQKDWSKHEYNLAELIDTSKVQNDIAIALIGCDRSDYFSKVVQSIGQNPEIRDFPVFAFLDKPAVPERFEETKKHEAILKEYIPHAYIIKRSVNLGCGRNIIDARMQLLNNMPYSYAFVFEDDMVISPTYIKYCLNLMKWAESNYDNVGAVQGWSKCHLSEENKKAKANEVFCTFNNWWGYLLKRTAWQDMKTLILEYQKLFLGGEYRLRPHGSILNWFKLVQGLPPHIVGDKIARLDSEGRISFKSYFDSPPSGQDAVTMLTFHHAGYVRLAPTANRGLYIGKQGIHMNPRMYTRDGYDTVSLDLLEGDDRLTEFCLRRYKERAISSPESKLMGT